MSDLQEKVKRLERETKELGISLILLLILVILLDIMDLN